MNSREAVNMLRSVKVLAARMQGQDDTVRRRLLAATRKRFGQQELTAQEAADMAIADTTMLARLDAVDARVKGRKDART